MQADYLPTPPMWRRVLAMVYDFLIAGTFISVIGAVIAAIVAALGWRIKADSLAANSIFIIYLLLGYAYLCWFWHGKKSATFGMWVWKMKIGDISGKPITRAQGILRYLALLAITGIAFFIGNNLLNMRATGSISLALLALALGLIWSYFDPARLALHEKLSATRLIDIHPARSPSASENEIQ